MNGSSAFVVCCSVIASGSLGSAPTPSQRRPCCMQLPGIGKPCWQHGAGGQVPHAFTAPSSISPSQSLSRPSHASAAGSTPPAHAVHCPSVQVCLPGLHSPTLEPHA